MRWRVVRDGVAEWWNGKEYSKPPQAVITAPLNYPVLKTLASLDLLSLLLKARISQLNQGSNTTMSPLPVAKMYHNPFFFFHLWVVWRTVGNHSEPSNWFPQALDLLIHVQAYLSIYKAPQHGHGLCTPSSSCTSFRYELTGRPRPRLWFGTQDTSVGR